MRLRRAVYYIPHKTDSRKGRRSTMTAAAFFELFHQYGLLLVCGVIFCEYMNLPGFPAGVIMPCIGVLIAQSSLSLPLTLVLSWYEQKAVCILLTLLHLGIRNIRLGPTLPAFLSPNVLNYLVDNFGIASITTPEADLKQLLK